MSVESKREPEITALGFMGFDPLKMWHACDFPERPATPFTPVVWHARCRPCRIKAQALLAQQDENLPFWRGMIERIATGADDAPLGGIR